MHLLPLLLLALPALAEPRRPSPTPVQPPPPPPSFFPTSANRPVEPSGVGYVPPQPTGPLPVHSGPIESTPLWIQTPGGSPQYDWCVDVRAHKPRPNAELTINKCNGRPGQQWSVDNSNSGPLKLAGIDLCLDAGKKPCTGSRPRLRRCDGSLSQTWYDSNSGEFILNDGRTDGYLCLDITGGSRAAGTPLQLYPCNSNNPNQNFYPGFCFYHSCRA